MQMVERNLRSVLFWRSIYRFPGNPASSGDPVLTPQNWPYLDRVLVRVQPVSYEYTSIFACAVDIKIIIIIINNEI